MERLNITLDDEQAEKLARLAERMHIQPGTVARSLLSVALDDADPDARNVAELLDGIPARLHAQGSAASRRRPATRSRSTTSSRWPASNSRSQPSMISTG